MTLVTQILLCVRATCCTGCWWCPAIAVPLNWRGFMALQASVTYSASIKGSIWPNLEHCEVGMMLCLWVLLAGTWSRLKAATCPTKAGTFHCKRAGSCLGKTLFGAWALYVSSLRNPMFWIFAASCNLASWLFVRKTRFDSPGINGAWFPVNPVLWLIDFLI